MYVSDLKGIDLIEMAKNEMAKDGKAKKLQKQLDKLADEGYGWPVENLVELDGWELVASDNTYNNGGEDWLDGTYLVNIVKNDEGEVFSCIQKHAGGDVRGNYYTPEVFNDEWDNLIGHYASSDAIDVAGNSGSEMIGAICEGRVFVPKGIKTVYELDKCIELKTPNDKNWLNVEWKSMRDIDQSDRYERLDW